MKCFINNDDLFSILITANFQLLKVEPSELAAQMSIYDSRLFRAITIEEILGFGWNGKIFNNKILN